MPEPFKNLYNLDLIDTMAQVLSRTSSGFDAHAFATHAARGLDELEMMGRADQISKALEEGLSESYLENVATLVSALHPSKTSELADMKSDASGIAGWAIVPLASYIARCGLGHPHESLAALREMTMRFSAEFAVRFFLVEHPDLTLATMTTWAKDPNHHVRRLASEGTRPLLPWGIKLHRFVQDPKPLMPILDQLKDDPSEYVRKSVANNLNDVSKNHEDLVSEIASTWLRDASRNRQRLVKHACRSLIKSGHPATFAAFGYAPPKLKNVRLTIPEQVTLGQDMPIQFEFYATEDQRLLIDYVMHFMRANGALSPKVFKWTEIEASTGEPKSIVKRHPYKPVTTRKDYAGKQIVSVQVNGCEVARQSFDFQI